MKTKYIRTYNIPINTKPSLYKHKTVPIDDQSQ